MSIQQITARARQFAKGAGLDGKDQLSRLLATLLALADALAIRQMPTRRDWWSIAAVLGIALLWAATATYLGYRLGRASVVQECSQHAFQTQSGIACLMWPD